MNEGLGLKQRGREGGDGAGRAEADTAVVVRQLPRVLGLL